MAWIDYQKADDMVPQSWILHCLKMYKVPDQIVQFIERTMHIYQPLRSGRRWHKVNF